MDEYEKNNIEISFHVRFYTFIQLSLNKYKIIYFFSFFIIHIALEHSVSIFAPISKTMRVEWRNPTPRWVWLLERENQNNILMPRIQSHAVFAVFFSLLSYTSTTKNINGCMSIHFSTALSFIGGKSFDALINFHHIVKALTISVICVVLVGTFINALK